MNDKILITGASGFVGSHLVEYLLAHGKTIVCALRSPKEIAGCEIHVVGNVNASTDWTPALKDVHTVIHCAARVHVMNDSANDPLHAFRTVNVDGSVRLAEQAASSGVSQFIYLSSVKVHGEVTTPKDAFSEMSMPQPSDAYGMSKWEAECALLALAERTGMALTIIRPPLVYGKGVGANFLSLLRWVKKQFPLPLGSVHNQRSFVFVKNLVSLIAHCIQNPHAYHQTFLVSDDHDLSTTELLKEAAFAMGIQPSIFPFPARLIEIGASLCGKKSIAERLCSSLQVDISKAKQVLSWTPPYTIQDGMRESVATFNQAIYTQQKTTQ